MVEKIVRALLKDQIEGLEVVTQPVIGIVGKDGPIADLYPETKQVFFYGEFSRTVSLRPDLKPLYDYLLKENYNLTIP